MAICRICNPIPCDNPPDLAAGIDSAIYSALDYSFEVTCPENCYCPPGLFPRVISILSSVIPPVIPPINEPGAPIILRLQGCSALITRTLDSTATQTQIVAAAQSMMAEWAGQQALCNALLVPGVNCNTGSTFIDVCNDPQNFICAAPAGTVAVPACAFTERLNTTGLTQAQIDAAVAQIKANLNNQAQNQNCLKAVCFVNVVYSGLPGSQDIKYDVTNNNVITPVDATQLCIVLTGPGSGTFCGAITVAPGGGHYVFDILPAFPNTFKITYQGRIVFTQSVLPPSDATVFIQFCGT